MIVYSVHASSGLEDCENSILYVPTRREAFALRDRILHDEFGTIVTIDRCTIRMGGGAEQACSLLNRLGFASETAAVGCWTKDASTGRITHETPKQMQERLRAFHARTHG